MKSSKSWDQIASRYAQISDDVRKAFLHPSIIKVIETDIKRYRSCLDYGCGPGDLSLQLVNLFDRLTLVDISTDALLESSIKIADRANLFLSQEFDTTEELFDSIILSMVITTIDKDHKLELLLKKLGKRLSKNGRLIVGTTHPCFTFRALSQIPYSSSSAPYSVTIEAGFEITEYHRPLEQILNTLSLANLRILKAVEIYDSPEYYFERGEKPHRFAGELPMFLILVCDSPII